MRRAVGSAGRCARARLSMAGGLTRPEPFLASALRPARFGPPPAAWWPKLDPLPSHPSLEPPPPDWTLPFEFDRLSVLDAEPDALDFQANIGACIAIQTLMDAQALTFCQS